MLYVSNQVSPSALTLFWKHNLLILTVSVMEDATPDLQLQT